MTKKRQHGQYFTKGNPFIYRSFIEWFDKAYKASNNKTLLEPFAGSNSITLLIKESFNKDFNWACFDIDPESNEDNITNIPIIIQDVLYNFPCGFDIAITNPPYLAKNSATRRGITFPYEKYDDLYKYCLSKMLDNVKYIAAIIPESFIVQNLFHDRLDRVISLKGKMFEDTECPVCLALFSPTLNNNFEIYSNDEYIGNYQELKKFNNYDNKENYCLKFNDPIGEIAVVAVDNHIEDSIIFKEGNTVDSSKIKETSRSITRIKLPFDFTKKEINDIINLSNNILKEKRTRTNDVFMTAFKGMRKDGKYRRRLDFTQIRSILNAAISDININR